MHILHVVGARPNFIKAAPVYHALAKRENVTQTLVHTGQHYDANMSEVFFKQLEIPNPDVNLLVGSGSHAQQTGEVMIKLEPVIQQRIPDWVLVYGDVNSTLAATLVSAKLCVRCAHIEAGLRSFDRTMPEEINRIVTDQLANLLFVPSEDGQENLAREGIAKGKIKLVGNVMIDTLIRLLPVIKSRGSKEMPKRYALLTIHRPANVDDLGFLRALMDTLQALGKKIPVIFPVHPRTQQRLEAMHADFGSSTGVRLTQPLSYLEFLELQARATFVITDSGGVQEETTFLQIPCLTVRDNTERPVTTTMGTNVLVGRNMERLRTEAEQILSGSRKSGKIPPLWDGCAAERIAEELLTASRAQALEIGSPART